MNWLKIALFIIWIFWLATAAYLMPTQSLLGTIRIVVGSALIMVLVYWFYSQAFNLIAKFWHKLKFSGTNDC
ncbi:hypothetical protein [Brevundimonas phoenicis]|uniref:hypothetical protein n=1 Tax=unclassified Brevundimonas TaxID=2622653 RepID=UPI0039A346D0